MILGGGIVINPEIVVEGQPWWVYLAAAIVPVVLGILIRKWWKSE